MPLIAFALEEFVQWRFGLMGAIGLGLLSFGLRARNAACTGVGSVVLALLLHSASV